MYQGGPNMKDLMRKAQKMQQDMMKAQEELADQVIEAQAGGGMVKVEINGKYEVKSLKIDPEVVDADDVEMLEDLILAAFKEALEKVGKNSEESMGKLTGGMKIPGLF
ncbi:MAG: YbaB/EbfC family nucleoid-associated protein [Candidatus Zophobacter franzmannii]|jgi:DNA-binding YbaB/EbfC family protein|nr:YbaB/EbfC family nucleoid-associated protein [Candidatus Zophobacter franzmannii]